MLRPRGRARSGVPPDVYNLADAAMKAFFDRDDAVHDLGVGPPFTVVAQGLHVESHPATSSARYTSTAEASTSCPNLLENRKSLETFRIGATA
jgi:hypothetical protein